MSESLQNAILIYLIPIAAAFLVAWMIHRLAPAIVRRMMGLSGLAPETVRPPVLRQRTLLDLFASTISFLAFAIAIVFILGRFIDTTTLVWVIGLFAGGIGFGARPQIADFITGINFIFEDTFDVGEKVEVLGVEGVVEKINLRTTLLRAPSGELYVIPNGEIRVIRNFSRGRHSLANVSFNVAASDLGRSIDVLEALSKEAVSLLPNLLEPWLVISESGTMGDKAELTLVAKARFGMAAEMRPRLLALVQERLSEAGINLAA